MVSSLGDNSDTQPDGPKKEADPIAKSLDLQPLPYLVAIRDYLQTEEKNLWDWFSKTKTQDEHAEAVRFDLLKTTYRIDDESDPEFYQQARHVAKQLKLDVPITLYQAHNPIGLNASICAMVNEAHIIFSGPITEKLSSVELDALIAHELGHLMLWRNWDNEFLTTELLLAALTNDARAQPAHFETARLFRLHTEIFCDRTSLSVIEDPLDAILMLVKITTDVKNVNATSYLKQAKEIAAKGELGSDGVTHPETFIRALAIDSWASADSPESCKETDKQIHQMIRGNLDLNPDLLGQQELSEITRQIIDRMLAHDWMQTDLTLAHAMAYFNEYKPPAAPQTAAENSLADTISSGDENLQKYIAYIILDFVAADRDLEHAPIALALKLCKEIGIKKLFCDIARKELRLRKKQVDLIDSTSDELIQAAHSKRKENQSNG